MSKKKVKFDGLKEGAKFRFERKLYMKKDYDIGVTLSKAEEVDFEIDGDDGLNTLVTPVKVKITVL